MQANETRDIWVGGAVFAVLAGLFAYSYAGKQKSEELSVNSLPVTAVFNRVDGLSEGDEVRLGGIRVGSVGKQELDQYFRAVVTLNLDKGIDFPVDSAAAIHTDGLFGSKFVVLEPGVEEEFLKPGDSIDYTQSAVVVGELLDLIIAQGHARQAAAAEAAEEAAEEPDEMQNQETDEAVEQDLLPLPDLKLE
ncbi:outer membrane lipid asymmetry maintenance protein MlaD [Magnetovibrio sp. PR-2]|uniref:outer membrane lipid asymmetry maintenance protein MlaD n=1 Tax=Magnetovibrio sp. PR-2 TaxID=3120356 RepID=UPI002FCE02A4